MEKQALDKLRTQVFGLYAGCSEAVFIMKRSNGSFKDYCERIMEGTVDYVLLRSIDSLTDEEAKEMAILIYPEIDPDGLVKKETMVKYCLGEIPIDGTEDTIPIICATYDYLRSIGIALPYLGHSVEELVQLGIVKLKI